MQHTDASSSLFTNAENDLPQAAVAQADLAQADLAQADLAQADLAQADLAQAEVAPSPVEPDASPFRLGGEHLLPAAWTGYLGFLLVVSAVMAAPATEPPALVAVLSDVAAIGLLITPVLLWQRLKVGLGVATVLALVLGSLSVQCLLAHGVTPLAVLDVGLITGLAAITLHPRTRATFTGR